MKKTRQTRKTAGLLAITRKRMANFVGRMATANPPHTWRNSLAFRYLSFSLILMVAVQILFGFVQVSKNFSRQLNNLENKVREEAEFLRAVSLEAILDMDVLTLERLLEHTSLDKEIIYGVFVNEDGRALTKFLDQKNPIVSRAISDVKPWENKVLDAISAIRKTSGVREFREPIISGDKVLGEVRLGYCLGSFKKELYRTAFTTLISSAIVSLSMAILTIIIFYIEVRMPLKELVFLARSLENGDLNRRANIHRNNELKLVGSAFNSMAVKLQYTLAGLQQKIIERERAEIKLRESLHDKDILLKEVHHRVKNNLLFVTSLLELQSEYAKDLTLVKALENSEKRLYSMALIYEKLSVSTSLEKIDFGDYIESLLDGLNRQDDLANKHLEFELEIEPTPLNIETAQPCGLILNELLSNAIEHGFAEGDRGKIKLAVHRQQHGQIAMTVADNGRGFPQHLNFRDPPSLGLQLVCLLTDQLEGTIDLDRTNGTSFQLKFKELQYRQRL